MGDGEQGKEKLGIDETTEVIDFCTGVVEDLGEHKKDDGEISTIEWTRTVLENAPAGLQAVRGISDVDDELKDLDADEARVLAAKGVRLAQALMGLLGADAKDEG